MRGFSTLWVFFGCFLFATPSFSLDYYWIGGSGNWSDISHWATKSGGTVTHNTAPTAEDDVFFDENSFSGQGEVVTIAAANAFCRSMTWQGATGTPVFDGAAGTRLNVYGSLTFIPKMEFSYKGNISFLSRTGGEKIHFSDHTVAGDVLFEGEGGGWLLQSAIVTTGKLELINGMLDTRDQPVTCREMLVQIALAGGLKLGESQVQVTGNTGGKNAVVAINADHLELDAASATFELQGVTAEFTVKGEEPQQFSMVHFTDPGGEAMVKGTTGPAHEFTEIRFAGNGNLAGVMDIGRLRLSEGHIYILQSEMTYRVGKLIAQGQCVAPIQIFASASGQAAELEATGGPITAEFVSLKDIHAKGSKCTATNSADLGNNRGWTIKSRSDNNLYWVGGTGSWDDPEHWSFSSGGAGGACVPTGDDNVVFDANSFNGPGEVVMINIENAFCRDMTWKGANGTPILTGDLDKNLRVFGSLRLMPDMEWLFEGDVHFESPQQGNMILTAGQLFNQDVIFDGKEGGWSLKDPFTVAQYVYFEQGGLHTDGQAFSCARFLSTNPRPRQLNLGSSKVTIGIPESGLASWELNVQNLEFDAGTSLIEFENQGQMLHKGSGVAKYHKVVFRQRGAMDSGQNSGMSVRALTFEKAGTLYHSWTIGRLELTAGYEYQFDIEYVQDIGELIAEGVCDAYISLRSLIDDVPAPIRSDRSNGGRYLVLKDIEAQTSNFRAENSIDLGNNPGWTIDNRGGRQLYWVGGSGDWEDPAHWSLSSGGPGGECIPTPADDVFFDKNSFDAAGQRVSGWKVEDHYCRNMDWSGARFEPAFDLSTLQLFGSLKLNDAMNVKLNLLRLRGEEANQTLQTNGQSFRSWVVEGSGSWKLLDEVAYIERLEMLNGTLNTNGQTVTCGRFRALREETPKTLRLGNSHIIVDDPGDRYFSWDVYEADFTLDAGTSTIELTDPTASMRNQVPLSYHRVLFTNGSGTSNLVTSAETCMFHLVRFNKNGVITGANTFDTLIFSPGKSYELEAGVVQTITSHFQVFGNNCSPIKLSSTRPGQQSTVFMEKGAVNGDFIQMRDQEATGGADFFAGRHSTDIGGSNTGWNFESAEAYVDVGFLGKDITLCRKEAITLDANNFSNDETYEWQDGSTKPTLSVKEAGTYWVKVQFGANCIVRDSIKVFAADAFEARLPSDTTLCSGDRLTLDVSVNSDRMRYKWQDGSTGPTLEVTKPGTYSVELRQGECTETDSVKVDFANLPPVELGGDTTLCSGASLRLDVATPQATGYLWQDSSTTSFFKVSQPGTYRVEVQAGNCIRRDSITVRYSKAVAPDLGPDTILCQNESLTLKWEKQGASYKWSDGSKAEALIVRKAGDYWVDVTAGGCTGRDSIKVDFKPLPKFDLGEDMTLCSPDTTTLKGLSANGADTYLWNDGTKAPVRVVDKPGTYWLEATLDGCSRRDSLTVRYITIPKIDFGSDTTICEGELIQLDIALENAEYRWQDDATGPGYTIREEGLYWGEVRIGQCSERDSLEVQYKPSPEIEIGNDTIICEGTDYSMYVQTNGDAYHWYDGSTEFEYQVREPGMIWAQAELDGCLAADTAIVEFQTPLPLDLGPDTVVCSDTTYLLDPGIQGDSYLWQDGSVQPTMMVSQPGIYSLEMVDGACTLRDTVRVFLRRCDRIYIPNAFSPNGDGVNDRLEVGFPPGLDLVRYDFKMFDRWGNLLFHSTDPYKGWNGNFRSKPLPVGVYVYSLQLEYRDNLGPVSKVLNGDVMIMR